MNSLSTEKRRALRELGWRTYVRGRRPDRIPRSDILTVTETDVEIAVDLEAMV